MLLGVDAVGDDAWVLTSARIDGAGLEMSPDTRFTLRRSGPAQLAGEWTCNDWFADLETVSDPAEALLPEVGQTAQDCGGATGTIEDRWVGVLVRVTGIERANSLLSGPGVQLEFIPLR